MAEHTPGPWIARKRHDWGIAIEGKDGQSIAWLGRGFDSRFGAHPYQEDANLIIAAPEMEAALEAVRARGAIGGMIPDVFALVEAALAKARGETTEAE